MPDKYRIDNSMNDAPYQGIHIFKDEEHIATFPEDDAPVPDYNSKQRLRAKIVVDFMNSPIGDGSFGREFLFDAFKHMKFIQPHERIKLEPKEDTMIITGKIHNWSMHDNRITGLMTEHTKRTDFNNQICTTSKVLHIVKNINDGNRYAHTQSGSIYQLLDT